MPNPLTGNYLSYLSTSYDHNMKLYSHCLLRCYSENRYVVFVVLLKESKPNLELFQRPLLNWIEYAKDQIVIIVNSALLTVWVDRAKLLLNNAKSNLHIHNRDGVYNPWTTIQFNFECFFYQTYLYLKWEYVFFSLIRLNSSIVNINPTIN